MVMAETQLSPESRLALSATEGAFEPARTPPPAFPFLHDQLVKEQFIWPCPPQRIAQNNKPSLPDCPVEDRAVERLCRAPFGARSSQCLATRMVLIERPAPVNTRLALRRKFIARRRQGPAERCCNRSQSARPQRRSLAKMGLVFRNSRVLGGAVPSHWKISIVERRRHVAPSWAQKGASARLD